MTSRQPEIRNVINVDARNVSVLGHGLSGAAGWPAAVESAGLSRCVAEGDRAGEVGYRGLDERWPLRGGAGWPGDEDGGEHRGAGECCRADPADLAEAGPELHGVGVSRADEAGDRRQGG